MTQSFSKWLGKAALPRDPFFRLLVINGGAGLLIAALVLSAIFYTNIGNLRVLVQGDSNPLVPVLMLGAGLIITLVSVVIGSAIMLLGGSGDTGKPGLRMPSLFALRPAPIQVPVRASSPRQPRA